MVFPLVRRTMSPKLRSRVRVLSNYGELTDEIDAEQLLPEVSLMFISVVLACGFAQFAQQSISKRV